MTDRKSTTGANTNNTKAAQSVKAEGDAIVTITKDSRKVHVLFENKDGTKNEFTASSSSGAGQQAGTPDQKGQTASEPKAPAPDPSTADSSAREDKGKSPEDCVETIRKIRGETWTEFQNVAKYVEEYGDRSFAKGQKCGKCPDTDKKAEKLSIGGIFTWAIILILALLLGSLLAPKLGSWLATSAGAQTVAPVPPIVVNCCNGSTTTVTAPDSTMSQVAPSPPTPPPQPKVTAVANTSATYQVPNADLVLMIADCIFADTKLLGFVNGDSLDGEHKKALATGMLATAVANGKAVKMDSVTGRTHLVDATYHGGMADFCAKMSAQAHLAVNYAQYWNERELRRDNFNYYANMAVDPLMHTAETDFAVATDLAIDSLYTVLNERGYGSFFYDMKIVPASYRKAKTSGVFGNVRATNNPTPTTSSGGSSGATKSSTSSGLGWMTPLPSVSTPYSGPYLYPVPPAVHADEQYIRGIQMPPTHTDNHYGHDIARVRRTPILSTADGVVFLKGYQIYAKGKRKGKGFGNYVAVYDGNYIWLYAHMNKPSSANVGDQVRAGQKIGEVGDTGSKDKYHLHVECWTAKEWFKYWTGDKNASPVKKELWHNPDSRRA